MTAPDYEAIAIAAGYRVAENKVANVGFYWRPNDDLNFSPAAVFPTEPEAWRHCCEINRLSQMAPQATTNPVYLTVYLDPVASDGPFVLCVRGPRGGKLMARSISAEEAESLYQQLAASRKPPGEP